uniref:30S ribosomal protein S16 n=1 Tax=Panagrolaimus sp. ES5 TaxID=591445 RepID=A0AC34FJJ9_9BILA
SEEAKATPEAETPKASESEEAKAATEKAAKATPEAETPKKLGETESGETPPPAETAA